MGQSIISLEFLALFTILLASYYSFAKGYQWRLLLAASYIFYALNTRWEFVALLAIVTIINFYFGKIIGNTVTKTCRKKILLLSIVLNCLILIIFKYLPFQNLLSLFRHPATIVIGQVFAVPLGISYYIFKAISYTVDVYRSRVPSTKNIWKHALFLSFFLEISAGPIDRASTLLGQVDSQKGLNREDTVAGLRILLWGLFKKFVIANNLALYVNQTYTSPWDYSGIIILMVTYFLAFQIYADFSGYTDIVRGAALLLGYHLPENFNTPYLSRSISEFWTRWHITLSLWLRDYLFLPLSYYLSRKILSNKLLAIDSNFIIYISSALITFIIAGAWHGSAWTFVAWGFLHGFYLSISNVSRHFRKRVKRGLRLHIRYPQTYKLFQQLLCFNLVAFTWIFFRSSSLNKAIFIVKKIITIDPMNLLMEIRKAFGVPWPGPSKYGFFISCFVVAFLLFAETKQKGDAPPSFLNSNKSIIRWTVYYVLAISILLFGEFGMKEFIYVQF